MNPEKLEKPAAPIPETIPPPFSETPKPPTPEMLAGLAMQAKLEKGRPEDEKEAGPEKQEKSGIETAREVYLSAKSEYENKRKFVDGLENLTEEERERHFEIDPVAKKVLEKFNLAREDYFRARGEDLGRKLEELETEFKDKGIGEEEYSKEMKKASSAYMISEFKKLYDMKTEMLSVQRQAETPWLMKKLYEVSDEYRKMPLKKKLIISGALIAGGAAAGAIGGGAGAALAAVIGGGHLGQRLLSSAGAFIGLEGLIKKYQEKELAVTERAKFGEVSEKVVEAATIGKKDELIRYLKSRDRDLESMGWAAEKDVRESERKLANRRYLISGTMGILTASGLTAEAIASVGSGLGLGEMLEGLSAKIHHGFSGSAAEAVEAATKEANHTVTIGKGGSVAQAAREMVKEGKLSAEQFRQAWENSYAEVKGIKVPIKDISLVHSGDQVVYVPEAGGAGHFEVVDYAKDKLGIGTNQDLYAMYEKSGKEAPAWLQKATLEDVSDAFKDDSLSGNDARVIEFHHSHGSLKDQLEIEEKLFNKMGLPQDQGKPFSDMFVKLSASPEHAQSMRVFENHLSEIGFDSSHAGEYEAIKNVRIGDLLENRGRSWFKDYFFSSELADKNGDKVSGAGMRLQRKLVEYVRPLVSRQDKQLTVEQFLQKLS